jgi:hypothetical protein
MNTEATRLGDREIYLLGVLAERNDIIKIGPGRLPRGCDDAHAQALVEGGYAVETAYRMADGRDERLYQITRKGMDAWRTYRFVH